MPTHPGGRTSFMLMDALLWKSPMRADVPVCVLKELCVDVWIG